MVSRRHFLKGAGITLLSLSSIPISKDLFLPQTIEIDGSKKESVVFEGNLEGLYQERALALLNYDIDSVSHLDSLIGKIENQSFTSYEIHSRRGYLIQTSVEYSKRFRRKNARKPELRDFNVHLDSMIRDFKDVIRNSTRFVIYKLEDQEIFSIEFDSTRTLITNASLKTLNKYEMQRLKLLNSINSKEPSSKRLAANTISNTAHDIKDIKLVSEREGIPINILLGISAIESAGNPFAIGRAGEIGRFQIKPRIAEAICKLYPDRFKAYAGGLWELLIRDSQLNATFAAIILNDANLNYPEKVLAYNQGITKIRGLDLDTLRSNWYVKRFERTHKALEEKLYLS